MPLTGSYTSDVQYLIEMGENAPLANDPNATNIIVQLDSKGRPFVGYGFDLLTYASNPSQALSALKAAGAVIVDEDQFNILLPHIPTSLTFNSGLLDLLAATFYLPDQASAVALLQSSIATAETGLNALTDDLGIGTIPDSNERAALVDMYYQLPGGDGINGYFRFGDGSFTRLSLALKSGNRAEAWFQIRYGSSDHGKNGLGVVARRYVDSQLFGLYASPDAPTEAEAIQAYQMLTYHRAQIVGYEQQFGSNPYGSDPYGIPAASQIAAANRTYSLNGTANQVQTLTQIFDSAAQEEIQYLAGQYSGVLPSIQVDDTGGTNSSSFSVRSIDFYAASLNDPTVDADNAPGALAADAAANHILLGSESGDQLIGGQGSDILIAQAGNETLQAGAGSDTLIANSGDDTLRLGGSSDVLDFVFPGSGSVETVIENNGAGIGSIDVSGSQIASGLKSTGADTWIDQGLNTYQFVPNPSATPAGYYPGGGGSDIGELKIITGNGNEIDVWGFNLSQAENSDLGFLGITLPPTVALTAGSTDGVDPPAPDFTAGATQSYTVSVDAPTQSAEAVTVTLTGAPASDFGLASGTSVIPLNGDGTFSVTIPAGQISATFSLVNTSDLGSAASLQLIASISDPTSQNDTISSAPVTQNYVEPADDPFGTPSNSTLYYQGAYTTSGGLAYNSYYAMYGDVLSPTPVGAGSTGNNYIYLLGEPNSSINGGAGNDTIFAEFGYKQPDGGVDVINGNGGQDDILASGGASDGAATIRIYGNSETDLATAIADANTEAGTGQKGDLIATSDPGTVVGGSGNDLILTGDGGVVVAGPGDDTIATGAPVLYTTTDWQGNSNLIGPGPNGVTWNTSVSNGSFVVGGGSIYLGRLSDSAPPIGYEGNYDNTGGIFGTTDDTIFGGAGSDLIYLSNGNDEVHLGIGDSTVYGGMGSDSIFAGSGNDCIEGGGGSDYIEAGSGSDWIMGRGGDNTIFGGSGSDTLSAGGSMNASVAEETGNDYVQAGSGNTLIYGSGGNDTLIGGSGTDTIQAGDGSESIVAGSGDTSINGGGGPDTIVAGKGHDTIWGSTQSTTIYGGTGTDWIRGSGGSDVIYAGDGGTSESATSVIAGSGDTTIYGGEGVDQIWGGSGSDVIYAGDGGTASSPTQIVAGSGNATVYGGNGVDSIFGGSGTDVLYAGDGGEEGSPTYVVAGSGVATLYGGAGVSFLDDSVSGSDVLQAGSGESTVLGIGQDTLIAGTGSDYLQGGAGSTYIFGANVGGAEVNSAGAETLDFTATSDLNDLSLSGVDGTDALAIDDGAGSITIDGALTGAKVAAVDVGSQSMSLGDFIQQEASLGNANAQTVAGAQGELFFDVSTADSIGAGSGQDTISAWGNNDTLAAGSGNTDILAGGTNDSVTGGGGNDTLEALGKGTTLIGGTGNEVFQINDATEVVQALAGAASNEIYASVSYTLPTNVDVLTLIGSDDLGATGNDDSANIITGNSGDDTLTAGSGSDTLVSGTGVDTLIGGAGPDVFVTNNSADEIDVPDGNGWNDTVQSSVSYVLSAPVSALQLTGSADLAATDAYGYAAITGNAGEDTLTAGSGSDTLIAGTGIDTLIGGSGSTVFVVNNTADIVQVPGPTGEDTIESSVSFSLVQGVDDLELTGSADLEGTGNSDASDRIVANSGDDTLLAGSGSDTLVAGSGSDTLVAGAGLDVLQGGAGKTTYVLDPGFSQVEIRSGVGAGILEFGAGIAPSDLTVGLVTDSYGSPALLIQDGSGAITVDAGLTGGVGSFDFADGTQLTLSELLTTATAVAGSISGSNGNAILDTSTAASLDGSGDDTILGTGVSDTLTGGIGDEYLFAAGNDASVNGGFGSDTLTGGGDNDTVVAGNGTQQLYALGTGDVLVGGMGSDTLFGGTGPDTLVGGTGNTAMNGGALGDSVLLTAGGTITFNPSSTSNTELIELPTGMTLADFTAYQGANGDLILQSLSDSTTAVIKGFYSGSSGSKLWMISDSTGAAQLLSQWLDSERSPPSGYQQEIDELRGAFAASLVGTLNQIGQQDGIIPEPSRFVPTDPGYQYQFNGVSTQNITVQGGAVTLANSDDDEATSTTLQTGSTTKSVTTPIYGDVTIPGWQEFIPDSSLTQQQIDAMDQELNGSGPLGITVGTDGSGNSGFVVTQLPEVQYRQTGTKTTIETVPEYTTATQESQSFTAYNVTGDGGNDVITVGPEMLDAYGRDIGPYFVGTVDTGNGNVSVNLGMNNGYDAHLGHTTYYYPNLLSPGAFVEAGSGVDTIAGTGGADVIAAGIGFDNITAAFGSTVYAPLRGASTEDIYIAGPYYGSGPLPSSTLVLPDGITPQDLHYRLINNVPNPNDPAGASGEALQITYGDSSVLMQFGFNVLPPYSPYFQNGSSSDTDGIDRFQFSDGTVLSRDQIVAMAGSAISESQFSPIVTALNPALAANSTISGASLFEASDSSGSDITWYQITNSGTGGAHFLLNGVVQTPGQTFYVSKDELSELTYTVGGAGNADVIKVSAFDGVVWGNTTAFDAKSTSSLYQATAANQEVTGGSEGPDTLVGGYQGDTLVGGTAQDTFVYNTGGGAETISETVPASSSSTNVLQFGTGITPASLALSAAGDPQLLLSLGSSGDSVSITGFDLLNPLQSFPIQTFAFADGTKLSLLQLLGDSAVAGSSGSITNADGSTTSYDFTPSGQQVYSARKVNSSGQLIASESLNADGSTDNWKYTYNSDGTWSTTEVTTPAGGGGSTTTIASYDVSGTEVSQQITNPDGSTEYDTFNSQGERVTADYVHADGSTEDVTYKRNSDGTSSTTDVSAPAGGGGSTTTIASYDASGNEVSQQITNPDGSTEYDTFNSQGQRVTADYVHADGSTEDVTYKRNSDGTSSTTDVSAPAGGGGSTTTIASYDASGNEVSQQITNPDGSTEYDTFNSQGQRVTADYVHADGSTEDVTYKRNSDGTSSTTDVSAPAGGGGSTTTITSYDASGNEVSQQIANPDASTEYDTFNTQGQRTSADYTHANGATDDWTFSYGTNGIRSVATDVSTPAGGGAAATSVYSYDAQGNQLSQNGYTPSADGSYVDTWSKADGSHGSYWWNASTSEYQENWYDSNGSSWTDDYRYASGGAPGATGYSFTETYSGSDGSQGSRQFDASKGTISLTWDSAATGSLSGTTTDSGFIGLQKDGELTNMQQDPTFFNPNVSASFNTFLAGH